MIRVLLVDDHPMVRAGLRTLLASAPDLEVAGEASSVSEAVEAAGRLAPDVVLMDLRLPDGSGVDACREILSRDSRVKVVFLTSHAEDLASLSTVLAGAAGYFLKDIGHESLVEAIRRAAEGSLVIDPSTKASVAAHFQQGANLSHQERRVLELVVKGMTNREIGADLDLSERTVRNYLSNAFQKLGVSRRSQAAVVFAQGSPRSRR